MAARRAHGNCCLIQQRRLAQEDDMHDSDNTIDPLLTPEQVAKLLVVSEETLSAGEARAGNACRLCGSEKFPRYRPQDVAAFVEKPTATVQRSAAPAAIRPGTKACWGAWEL